MDVKRQTFMVVVGHYIEKFNILTGQDLECKDIVQSSGLLLHIQKRHPDCVDKLPYIPLIIAEPDYIGRNPREENSIELVKCMGNNLMVCVKLDIKRDYFYVASLFEISDAKLQSRLKSGRISKFY